VQDSAVQSRMRARAVSAHVLKIKHLDWAQSYEPRGSWVRVLPGAPLYKDLGYQNQVLLDAVGPLWDPLSTGTQSPRATQAGSLLSTRIHRASHTAEGVGLKVSIAGSLRVS